MEEKKWAYEIVNGKAIIPQGTKKIVPNAFYGCEELISVEIPEGVTHICECAFRSCTNLQEVILPESLEYIDDCAFAHCPALGELTIGDRIKEISEDAFYNSTIDGITIYKEEPTGEMIYAIAKAKIRGKVIVPGIDKYVKAIDNFNWSKWYDDKKKTLINIMEDCGGVTYDMFKEYEKEEKIKAQKKEDRKNLKIAIIAGIGGMLLFILIGLLAA